MSAYICECSLVCVFASPCVCVYVCTCCECVFVGVCMMVCGSVYVSVCDGEGVSECVKMCTRV